MHFPGYSTPSSECLGHQRQNEIVSPERQEVSLSRPEQQTEAFNTKS
jgi:hypothetical protein